MFRRALTLILIIPLAHPTASFAFVSSRPPPEFICAAALTNLRERALNKPTVDLAKRRLADLIAYADRMAREARNELPRRKYAELKANLESLASRPRFVSDEGFALTEFIDAFDVFYEMPRRDHARATALVDEARRKAELEYFSKNSLIKSAGVAFAVLGLAAVASYVVTTQYAGWTGLDFAQPPAGGLDLLYSASTGMVAVLPFWLASPGFRRPVQLLMAFAIPERRPGFFTREWLGLPAARTENPWFRIFREDSKIGWRMTEPLVAHSDPVEVTFELSRVYAEAILHAPPDELFDRVTDALARPAEPGSPKTRITVTYLAHRNPHKPWLSEGIVQIRGIHAAK